MRRGGSAPLHHAQVGQLWRELSLHLAKITEQFLDTKMDLGFWFSLKWDYVIYRQVKP